MGKIYYMSGLISLKEASRISGYHQDYLSSLIRGSKLHGERLGRNWCVRESDLRMFMVKKLGDDKLVVVSSKQQNLKNKPAGLIVAGFLIILLLIFYLYVAKFSTTKEDFTSKKDLNFGAFQLNTIYSEHSSEVSSGFTASSTRP